MRTMQSWASSIAELFVGERYAPAREQARATLKRVFRSPLGAGGIAIIVAFIGMAGLAPFIAGDFPNYATRANVCLPNLPPGSNPFAYEVEEDTYIATNASDTPYGNATEIRVTRSGGILEWGIVSFRFSLCPADTIRSASLRFTVLASTGSAWPATLTVARLVPSVSEDTTTWTGVPADLRDTFRSHVVPAPLAAGDALVLDVTPQLEAWQAVGGVPFGIVVSVAVPSDAGLVLASRENAAYAEGVLETVVDSGLPLGTDVFGRSIFALLVYGAQVSLIVGFTSSIIAILVGAFIGVVAGYYGGGWDQVFSRITDFFLVIPWLPFVLVLAAVMGRGFETTVIAIAIVSWPTTARVVRSKVLSVKTLAYVERARAIGAGDGRIMMRHVMPVLGPLIFANMILTVSTSIFTESFLAFFGLGDTARPSWGTMIENAFRGGSFFRGQFWYVLPPGICITALVLAFTMVSYALEEILNPKLRKR
jgi:peptide/nickel transport system permease protein